MGSMNSQTQGAEAIPETMGGLVAIGDQLEAAVSDVRQAWGDFRFGERPQADKALAVPPRDGDRLAQVHGGLLDQVATLKDLAQEIRGRA